VQDLQPYASGKKLLSAEWFWDPWPWTDTWRVDQEDLDAASDCDFCRLDAARLREGPPVLRSQVRGVEVRVVLGCTEGGEGWTEAQLAELVDRRVAEAFAAHQAHDAPGVKGAGDARSA
jgi:hypothetical protein